MMGMFAFLNVFYAIRYIVKACENSWLNMFCFNVYIMSKYNVRYLFNLMNKIQVFYERWQNEHG